LVNYDFLDVVHNYSNEGNRLELLGLYTEFKIGFFYSINKPGTNNNSQNNKKKKGKSTSNNHLPFAN